MRNELQQKSALNQVTTETSEQIVERIRSDQQRQDDSALKARNEMERLRQVHETTLVSWRINYLHNAMYNTFPIPSTAAIAGGA